MLLPLALAAWAPLAGCQDASARRSEPQPPACLVRERPTSLPTSLPEASGVAISRALRGVLWMHNDSGSDPLLVAVDAVGLPLGRVRVAGAKNQDWEDLALGPCPAGDCLYIADIGDNDGKRPQVVLYRIPEPRRGDTLSAPAERFRLRYPGGPRDAEALFVLPGGEVYVVAKGRDHPVALYRTPGPLGAGAEVELQHVRDLGAGPAALGDQVTAASASADGRWVAIRTYRWLYLYQTADLLAGGGEHLKVDLATLEEAQGEGVALGEGGVVVLTSEGGKKKLPGTLAVLSCALPADTVPPAPAPPGG